MSAINVVLDVRGLRSAPKSADELKALWADIESRLVGSQLPTHAPIEISLPDSGTCAIWLHDAMGQPVPVRADSTFSIRGVLERGQVVHKCTTCQASQRTNYGPFLCSGCGADGRPGRVCEEHAVFIDGRLTPTCARHRPSCSMCGAAATFACDGTRCGRKAYCDAHRTRHPAGLDFSYCSDCYSELYPRCASAGCNLNGSIACEFVPTRSGEACGERACGKHAHRWQIFGPHNRGLGLCPNHARIIKTLGAQDLVFQITAGTANRRRAYRGDPKRPPRLPRLTIMRHIMINVRKEVLDMRAIDQLVEAVRASLGPGTANIDAMQQLITESKKKRTEDIETDEAGLEEGRRIYAGLQSWLVSKGRGELAQKVTFSDYRSRSKLLFVRVPREDIGRFVGKGGAEIKALSADLGVKVTLEDK